jgi:nucleoside-diphosphate-sugar epimerase
MKVFVTGATGFIGSAVVLDLLGAGHQVVGLTRSDKGAEALQAAGAKVHRGDLEDLESLKKGAAAADGVIHTGFVHDFSKFKESCEIDRRAIAAMADALAGSGRPLVISSGTALVAPGRLATEDMPTAAGSADNPRAASEEAVAAAAQRGVRASAVRLAPSVHGVGDHGFIPLLIGLAREKGVSAYVGDGLNRWPGVHRLDAARLFRLALEKGEAGARYHGAAEEGVPFKDIAAVIARRLSIPLVGMSTAEAAAHFTWFAHFAAIDNPTANRRTREALGWEPREPGLIADIDQPSYFETKTVVRG